MTYLFWLPISFPYVFTIFKHFQDLLDCRLLLFHLLHLQRLAATAGLLDEVLMGLLDELDILDAELLADDVEIANRVDVALDVDDLGVIERADDLEDAVDGADVGEEGVAEACAC